MLDYFSVPIEIGDIVTFPSSGIFEDGKVIGKFNNNRQITILNISGYKKMKYCKDVINKSRVFDSLKLEFPEHFI